MSLLRLLPAVLNDIAEAADWYDEQGYPGLGDRFVDTFYFYVRYIEQHGKAYPQVYDEFHRILLKPLPYAAYFRYHEDSVVVSLVFHTARNPRLLRRMLKERQVET